MSVNPYAPPREALPDEPEIAWYGTDLRNASFQELWNLTRSLVPFLYVSFCKLLRIRIAPNLAFAPEYISTISPAEIPENARTRMRPLADEALQLGMRLAFIYIVPQIGNAQSFAAAFISQDGLVYMPLMYAKSWAGNVVQEQAISWCVTRLRNGQTLVTTARRRELDNPPEILVERMLGQPLSAVHARHMLRLRDAPPAAARVFSNDTELFEFIREYERESSAYYARRRFFVPLSGAELDSIRMAIGTPHNAQPPQAFQGIETLCWIAVAISTFFLARPGNLEQVTFRVAMLAVPLLTICGIYLWRFLFKKTVAS